MTEPTRLTKITGLYRWHEGAHFDHNYYGTAHARLSTELLTPLGLLRFESEKVLHPGTPTAGAVVATSNAYFPSLSQARAALAQVGSALAADLPHYTNIRPVLHLSEVLTHSD